MANEKRLIDADALKKAILTEPWKDQPNIVRLTVDYINIIIDEQHTVYAEPVVHGRWVDTGKTFEDEKCRYNYWECSECNNQIAGRYGLHNYCPNCGAKMDGERKDNERKAD